MEAIAIIERSMGPAALVVMRLGGLFIFAPLVSMSAIPGRIKGLLVLVTGVGAWAVLSQRGVAFPAVSIMDPWAMVPLGAAEIAIGAMIGFVASLPIFAMQTGGLVMGQQMGLGFARFYNPAADAESDVLEQLMVYLAIGMFLVFGGLDAIFLCVLRSFEYVDAGVFVAEGGAISLIIGVLLAATEFGLRIAVPLLGVVFLETVAMGFVSKTVPQLNVLSLGFPVRIIIGLVVVYMAIDVIGVVNENFTGEVLDVLHAWALSARPVPGGGA
ncbi:MAG: flagellar biosynthetic protein FliR [Planctomycetota bacterium]|nr:flagellar biosynthetic protein FliR [Planctomycetota bacterium]